MSSTIEAVDSIILKAKRFHDRKVNFSRLFARDALKQAAFDVAKEPKQVSPFRSLQFRAAFSEFSTRSLSFVFSRL